MQGQQAGDQCGPKSAGFRAGFHSTIQPKSAQIHTIHVKVQLPQVPSLAILGVCSLKRSVSATMIRDREVGSSNLLAPTFKCRKDGNLRQVLSVSFDALP